MEIESDEGGGWVSSDADAGSTVVVRVGDGAVRLGIQAHDNRVHLGAGAGLSSEQARELAERLHELADQVDGYEE